MLIHSHSPLWSVLCMLASAPSSLSLFPKTNVGGHQGSEQQHAHKEEEATQVHQQASPGDAGAEDLARDVVQLQVTVLHLMPILSLAHVCIKPRHGLHFVKSMPAGHECLKAVPEILLMLCTGKARQQGLSV